MDRQIVELCHQLIDGMITQLEFEDRIRTRFLSLTPEQTFALAKAVADCWPLHLFEGQGG
jgi:hypothetical protein